MSTTARSDAAYRATVQALEPAAAACAGPPAEAGFRSVDVLPT